MAESNAQAGVEAPRRSPETVYRYRRFLGFSLFFLFFVYYMVTAIIQTPTFQAVASTPFLGMPLGLFMSLMVFPVSWILIGVFFYFWR